MRIKFWFAVMDAANYLGRVAESVYLFAVERAGELDYGRESAPEVSPWD